MAIGWPLIFTGAVSTSETNVSDVGASRRLALVVDQPVRPGIAGSVAHGLNGPRAERHRLGGIGDVFVEWPRRRTVGAVEAQLQAGAEIERRWLDRAAARAAGGQDGSRRHVLVPVSNAVTGGDVRLRRSSFR